MNNIHCYYDVVLVVLLLMMLELLTITFLFVTGRVGEVDRVLFYFDIDSCFSP
jgi:hypothetical protein